MYLEEGFRKAAQQLCSISGSGVTKEHRSPPCQKGELRQREKLNQITQAKPSRLFPSRAVLCFYTPSPPSPQSPRSRPIPGGMPLTPLPPPMVQGYPAHKRHCPGWGSLGTQGFWVPAGLGRHMGEPWALSWSSTLPRLGGSRLVQRLRRVLSPMADHTQPCLGQVGVTSPSGASRIL